MDHEDHVSGVICDDGIQMSGCIVKELVDLCHCVFGRILLLSGDGAKGWEHGCIDGYSVIEESASEFLNKFFVGLAEERTCVGVFDILCLCSVCWFYVRVRLVLRPSRVFMVETFEGIQNV